MRCPYCGSENTSVKDSRPTDENASIRRRRECPDCGGRFTTFERVQLRELVVVKRSGRKVTFDRDKLMKSVTIATRKRPIDDDRIERMVSGIVRQLESLGRNRNPVLADRRTGHGGVARARSRRLRALCVRLSRLSRGRGLPGGSGRDRRVRRRCGAARQTRLILSIQQGYPRVRPHRGLCFPVGRWKPLTHVLRPVQLRYRSDASGPRRGPARAWHARRPIPPSALSLPIRRAVKF